MAKNRKTSRASRMASARAVEAKDTKKPTITLAIIALLLNLLILPGLGSLIAGKTRQGLWQVILTVIGLILMIIIIGIPIILVAWIWGIITGANLIKEAQK